jgi:hypothetical protein
MDMDQHARDCDACQSFQVRNLRLRDGKLALLGVAIGEHGERSCLRSTSGGAAEHSRLWRGRSCAGVCDPPLGAVYWLAISELANPPEVARLLDEVGRRKPAALTRTLAQPMGRSQLRDSHQTGLSLQVADRCGE